MRITRFTADFVGSPFDIGVELPEAEPDCSDPARDVEAIANEFIGDLRSVSGEIEREEMPSSLICTGEDSDFFSGDPSRVGETAELFVKRRSLSTDVAGGAR